MRGLESYLRIEGKTLRERQALHSQWWRSNVKKGVDFGVGVVCGGSRVRVLARMGAW